MKNEWQKTDRDTRQNFQQARLTLREIAKSVGLPVEVVGRLQDIKAIGTPITTDDMTFLEIYKKTWGNTFLIKKQLANMPKKRRESILTRPELANKWELWVYHRFLYNEIEYDCGGRMLTPQKRMKLVDIAEMLNEFFHIPRTERVMERIKKIREMAFNDRKKIARDPQSEHEILMKRVNKKNRVNLEAEFFKFDMYS
jgi:hypothetical protein